MSAWGGRAYALEYPPADAALGDRALPGVARLVVPVVGTRPLTFGGSAAYGFTEGQELAPGNHHRVHGQLALSLAPLEWLSVAGRTQLRYDRHGGDTQGSDDGAVLESDLYVGSGFRLAPRASLGFGIGAAFARGDDLSASLQNPALEASVQAAFQAVPERLQLAINLGFRYDLRANGISEPETFRPGDRLALGLSDFHAGLVAAGGTYRLLGDTHLAAELSADVLLGADAPSIAQSPLRATLGVSHTLADDLWLRVLADAALSQRPEATAYLTPVEPRASLLVGLQYRFGSRERVVDVGPPPALEEEPATPQVIEATPQSSVAVEVTDAGGFPISDASVQLISGGVTLQVPHRERSTYQLEEVAIGEYTLQVSAARLQSHTQSIVLKAGKPLQVGIRMQSALPSGQIRGLVRSFGGRGLAANVRIEPIGKELSARSDGSFDVDVPPGKYVVTIQAPGHRTQRRSVTVKRDGVLVLNADLQEAPR